MLIVIGVAVGIAVGGASCAARGPRVRRDRLTQGAAHPRAAPRRRRREAEAVRREAQIEAREQAVKLRAEIDAEVADRRAAGREDRGARAREGGGGRAASSSRSTGASRASPTARRICAQLQDELKAGEGRSSWPSSSASPG